MLTIQTNDGLSTANSYAAVTDLENYVSQRGIVLTSTNLESLLIKAMDVLESKQYKSEPINNAQSTLFPRMGVEIPRAIKQAQLMLAVAADSVDLLKAANDTQVKRERVEGAVDVEYFESKDAVNDSPLLTMVNELLSPYLVSTSQWAANVRVYRG